MRRSFLVLSAVALLAACGAAEPVWAPDDVVAKATYRHNGPPRLTLFTMVSNDTGAGAHTSLMINGSQRVIFDPAGSFKHSSIAERNDVVFGVTPALADVYTRYHARETYHVVVQTLDVPAEVAEKALQTVLNYGAVPKAQCAKSTSDVLSGLQGFEQIKGTWYPNKLAEQFGQLPGVTTRELFEYDDDDKSKVLRDYVPPSDDE